MVLVGMFRCGGRSSWICKGSVSCDWMAFGDLFASHVTNRALGNSLGLLSVFPFHVLSRFSWLILEVHLSSENSWFYLLLKLGKTEGGEQMKESPAGAKWLLCSRCPARGWLFI